MIDRLRAFLEPALAGSPMPLPLAERLVARLAPLCGGGGRVPAKKVEAACAALDGAPGEGWPAPGSTLEDAALTACMAVFLEPKRSEQPRRSLQHLLGDERLGHLLRFLGHARAYDFWLAVGVEPADTAQPSPPLPTAADDARFRAILGSSIDHSVAGSSLIGVWDWDIVNDIVVADPGFADFYGLDPARTVKGAPIDEFTAAIHPADLARVNAAIRQSLRTASDFAEEYRLARPGRPTRWVFARGRVQQGNDGRAVRLAGVAVDITERKLNEERQRHLVELNDRVRELQDSTAIAATAAAILGRALDVSRAGYARIEDERTAVIETDWTNGEVASASGRHRLEDFGELLPNLKKGEILAVADVGTDPRTHAGAASFAKLGIRGLLNVPLIENGRLAGVLFLHDSRPRQWSANDSAFARDVAERAWAYAERARAEARQRLLARELQHRVKNTLAMVQAIVSQSLRSAATPDTARATITQRLQVLAQAHENLMRPGHASAPLEAVITSAISVCAGESGRVRLTGPPLEVQAKPALALSMALHELCTNAVKYGALSNDTGHVDVQWLVAERPGNPMFQLEWSEHGGPPVTAPERRGFGSRLIERGLAADLDGRTELDFEPGGIVWRLTAPLSAIRA